LKTHRLKLKRPRRAYDKWLRPLLSFRQAVFNPWVSIRQITIGWTGKQGEG
jgi:hypothetical protein